MAGTGVVTFDYTAWSGQYPEFAPTVSQGQAQADFNQACFYLDNTSASIIVDASVGGRRETILYLLTSHIAQMLQGSATQGPSSVVGQITAATEGTVSVTTAAFQPASAAWFAQTKYGIMAWQAMAPYRTGLYVAAPQIPRSAQSYPGFRGL